MGKFSQGFKIPRYFGDFGGDYSERDTVVPMNNTQAKDFEALLASDEFAAKYDEVLKIVKPEDIAIKTYRTADERNVYIAPSLAKYYMLAGYLTVALFHKRKKAVMGTYSKDMIRAFARSAKALGLAPKACLSRALCADKELVAELKSIGTEVDDFSCLKMLDAPYAYINFDEGMGFEVIPAEANYGIYPRAAMSGILASLYGRALKEKLAGTKIDTIAIAITTGTEAVGVMREFADMDVKMATVERRVCKEFHTEDAGCFTLVTRTDDYHIADTSINPEVCYWWRCCKVYRLGADRVYPVKTDEYQNAPFGELGKRALKLVTEALDPKDILLVEER